MYFQQVTQFKMLARRLLIYSGMKTKNENKNSNNNSFELGSIDHINSIELDIPKKNSKIDIAGRPLTGYETKGNPFLG
jgi:hypothetical protein